MQFQNHLAGNGRHSNKHINPPRIFNKRKNAVQVLVVELGYTSSRHNMTLQHGENRNACVDARLLREAECAHNTLIVKVSCEV